ncbi:PEP-CTERM sorting domain-containing protein [Trichloromonas sp.]|uniref:PEP-CTERM sorting domain-containing protein n=1 Tax=Trichloromonas sp. TaxID=3069249 RepID=UPI002A37AE73|nr:PEP-CTERM sorting domain-containing protein [Trichloromonas sp.]
MKKILGLVVGLGLVAITAGTGYAMPLIWDVGAASAPAYGDADTLTGVFDQIAFASQTSTIQYDTNGNGILNVGDRFGDAGDLRVNDLLASGIIDKEGLNQLDGYEVTAQWSDLTGYVAGLDNADPTNTRLDLIYDGGTINFYLDAALDSEFANPAGSAPPAGAGGTGFANGTLIATLSVLQGLGHTFLDFTGSDLANQGSVELSLQFSYLLDDFWLNALGVDLLDIAPVDWYFMTTDMNIDTPTNVPYDNALYIAYSNQNGSGEMTVVPEPSTLLLLGGGLLGLAFVGRKRSRKE